MSERLDKLLSREFLCGVLMAIIMLIAYVLRDGAEYSDLGFWLSVAFGLPTGALTIQKAAGSLTKGGQS